MSGIWLRNYAAAELARAIACLAWRGGRFHTGIHQARKSLRRTRATLALGMPALGPGAILIDRELRRMNRRLSKLRDTHALVETLDLLLEKVDDDAASRVLRRARRIAAHARAGCARSTLTDDPQLQDKRALLAALQAALPALRWDALSEADMCATLRLGQIRADEAGARAQANGRDEDWHRWRRRARRLSQQHRALGDLAAQLPEAGHRHKALAVLLGEAQDYSLLREHCGKRSAFAESDRQVLRALTDQGMKRLRERVAKVIVESAADMPG
ncbi:CHAD domain-containing protein [Dokdonella soli]|uniref:CHAD domain-containing protein n=1 Tax=Dokdonella soli TaxID=529810 RepID=A0ABN1IRE0_9GAMM